MDVAKLRHLAAVVKLRSFSRAAEALGISQPALSKNIRALEQSLGVQLLERGRFGAIPTEFGLELARHCDAVDAELRVAAATIEALRHAKKGHLAIGCGPSEAVRLLPLALQKMHRQAPDVRISVRYGLNETLLPMVKHGDVEFALSSIPPGPGDRELRRIDLHHDAAAVVVRARHPLTKLNRPLGADDLQGWSWVLARGHELERRALEEACVNLGLPSPEPVLETDSAELMKSMVMQSDYLTFLPRELIHWEEQAQQLRTLELAAPAWRRVVGVTMRARARLSPNAEAMIKVLQTTARLDLQAGR